ncbi:MAG: hypothetical protein R3F59_13425 [Myxococcota bacterium]
MRTCPLALLALAAACRGEISLDVDDVGTVPEHPGGPGTGWETSPWEQPTQPTAPDTSRWDGAWIRIDSPAPDGLVPLEAPSPFEATIYGADGAPITEAPDRVQWFASGDPDFEGDSLSFPGGPLELGTHEITVIADLPNGDRVAHTVGGVKSQSEVAGTYAGLFSVDGSVNNIVLTCPGAAVMTIDPDGTVGDGEGKCLVSLLGIDVPMTWDFALLSDAGELSGEAAVNLLGFFSYDVPMTDGTVDPAADGLDLSFAGEVPFVGTLTAFLQAPRVSLDVE